MFSLKMHDLLLLAMISITAACGPAEKELAERFPEPADTDLTVSEFQPLVDGLVEGRDVMERLKESGDALQRAPDGPGKSELRQAYRQVRQKRDQLQEQLCELVLRLLPGADDDWTDVTWNCSFNGAVQVPFKLSGEPAGAVIVGYDPEDNQMFQLLRESTETTAGYPSVRSHWGGQATGLSIRLGESFFINVSSRFSAQGVKDGNERPQELLDRLEPALKLHLLERVDWSGPTG